MIASKITSTEIISAAFLELGILTFEDAAEFLRGLPYGRNASREPGVEVLTERKGTCSSKHGLLRCLAQENNWNQIKLHMVIYAMSQKNTPGIGSVLEGHDLLYIPEAHCVISVNDEYLDVTTSTSDASHWGSEILSSRVIEPEDIVYNKIQWHREFIDRWIELHDMKHDLDEIWMIRESCIEALAQNTQVQAEAKKDDQPSL